MGIVRWFSGLFSDDSFGDGTQAPGPSGLLDYRFENDGLSGTDSSLEDNAINPASGLPMVGGTGGVDVEGNPYGTDAMDDEWFSSIDDSFDCGSGFDDW